VTVAAPYGPVQNDLARVEQTLSLIADGEFPWLSDMLGLVLNVGGKRLRPAIALLAGQFGSYNLDLLAPLAASIELLHTATLVHDDVIDSAMTRRGRPTVNSSFSNAATVMLGDYLFAHAAELIARTDNTRVVRLFATTLMKMAKGELHQDMSAYDYSLTVMSYFGRISGKTASLFAAASAGGAIVSGLDENSIENLRDYGESLGMAFQIVDDILDFTGDAREMGKPVGSDLMQGTLTLPALLFMERTPGTNPIQRFFTNGTRKDRRQQYLNQALELINNSDVLQESYRVATDFRDRALTAVSLLPPCEARDTLTEIAEYVIERRN
jgi:geranylgeranyl pyrophosphate synthase